MADDGLTEEEQRLLREAEAKAKEVKDQDFKENLLKLAKIVGPFLVGAGVGMLVVPADVAVAAAALLYFISPIDLVPDPILPFGLMDDAAVVGLALLFIGGGLAAIPGGFGVAAMPVGLDAVRAVLQRAAKR